MIIHLISSPRTISTAMMYSFAQRTDTVVIDEPFYGVYLTETGLLHPGREDTISSMPDSLEEIVANIDYLAASKNVFIKNIASHFTVIDPAFARNFSNVLLIRDPKRIVTSFDKVIPSPTQQDIGIKKQYELYHYFSEIGHPPKVIDSTRVAANPLQELSTLCHHLDLPFETDMLSWEKGPKPYDGVWAKYWYGGVHRSTGFNPPSYDREMMPDHLRDLYEEAKKYYDFLSSKVNINSGNATEV